MTEQEYIDTQDLIRLRCASEILRGIVVENSTILDDSFKQVIIEIDRLAEALVHNLRIEE